MRHDFYILHTAGIHILDSVLLFSHTKHSISKHMCVTARWKELKQKCCKSVSVSLSPGFPGVVSQVQPAQYHTSSMHSHLGCCSPSHPYSCTLLPIAMATAGSYKRRSCRSFRPSQPCTPALRRFITCIILWQEKQGMKKAKRMRSRPCNRPIPKQTK